VLQGEGGWVGGAFAQRRPVWQPLLILVGPGLLILVFYPFFHFSITLKNTGSLPPSPCQSLLFLPPLFALGRLLVLRNLCLCTRVRVGKLGLAIARHVLMVMLGHEMSQVYYYLVSRPRFQLALQILLPLACPLACVPLQEGCASREMLRAWLDQMPSLQ